MRPSRLFGIVAGIGTPDLVAVALVALALGRALGAGDAFAQAPPSADQILAQMKAALEPPKSSIRRMTMTLNEQGSSHTFGLVQARKHLAGGDHRSLTVLLAPEDAKGLAYLVSDKEADTAAGTQWLYLPMVRRVRELVSAEDQTSFLGSDFTYADLGFVDLDTTNKLLGTETIDGKKQYKIESIPNEQTKQWYYARVVTWVDAETLLPVTREFYSPSGMRFKVETFSSVSRVDGVPTPFAIVMETVPAKTSTSLKVEDVAYGADIPDEYFGPDKLSTIAKLALWTEKKPGSN